MEQDIAIVTEGNFDAKVLEKLLQGKQFESNYEILPSNGYSSALSKIKSLLTIRNKRIILLLDTDTINENEIQEKKEFVNFYINANLNKDNFIIFWAVPQLEVIFFNNKAFLKELPKNIISEDILNNNEFINVARTAPRSTLEGLFNISRDKLIDFLDKKEIRDEFYKEGLIKEIVDYMKNKSANTKRFTKGRISTT